MVTEPKVLTLAAQLKIVRHQLLAAYRSKDLKHAGVYLREAIIRLKSLENRAEA